MISTPDILQPLPAAARPFSDYAPLLANEIRARTWEAKRTLGARAVVLGHHYQRESVIEFADFRGDSLKLSQLAASRAEAEFIVFCGVHFMAESADVLRQPHQTVILPDLKAGCSMADMAIMEDVEEAWERLVAAHGDTIVPITYMNSTAALKAFCGARGGLVCTSSNARSVLEWAWSKKPRVFFFPDQHLGRNTAHAMGVPLDHMAEWDFRAEDLDGVNRACFRPETRIILWRGFCSVHTKFTKRQIDEARAEDPAVKVLVHPECPFDVVQNADVAGSTEFIIEQVRSAPPGTHWAIGTEINLVHRLADAPRLVPVDVAVGLPRRHGAEPAAARAQVAQDHDRRGAARPAVPEVGAARFLAHRDQSLLAQQRLRLGVLAGARELDLEPVREPPESSDPGAHSAYTHARARGAAARARRHREALRDRGPRRAVHPELGMGRMLGGFGRRRGTPSVRDRQLGAHFQSLSTRRAVTAPEALSASMRSSATRASHFTRSGTRIAFTT